MNPPEKKQQISGCLKKTLKFSAQPKNRYKKTALGVARAKG